ncbi:unnamed protein product [Gadus morhua 'NCC']
MSICCHSEPKVSPFRVTEGSPGPTRCRLRGPSAESVTWSGASHTHRHLPNIPGNIVPISEHHSPPPLGHTGGGRIPTNDKEVTA